MGWHWNDSGGWMAMGGVMLLWFLLAVVVVLLVWWVVRSAGPATGRLTDSAEEVLRRRFAAGEIDDDEYRHRLSMLRG